MKILVAGDSHFGLSIGGYDFFDDIVRAFQVVVEASDKVDLFVHLGDLFHTSKPGPREYETVIGLIDQLSVPGVFLAGNHDVGRGTVLEWTSDNESYRVASAGSLEPLSKVRFRRNMQFIDSPVATVIENFEPSFLFAPYITDTLAQGLSHQLAQELVNASFEEARRSQVKAAFCHLDVGGARLGSEQAVLKGGELTLPNRDLIPFPVCNGHIHKRQKLGGVYFPGSMVPTDFSDVDGARGYMILEV